ncbi:C40 family peptidase (plasmid) [Legionella sp. D16C41]|uniref:C40 family peptidase n=1 Tax=Legionella sp. D16C41 TaxID=3402688 RepID=UPI003AF9AB05
MLKFYLTFAMFFCNLVWAENINYGSTTISVNCLANFDLNPPNVKKAIKIALDLANQHLGYQYGSADPSTGGMDCSGTIYYLLTKLGIKSVPRSSEGLYQWVLKYGSFHPTTTNNINTTEFSNLKPGDLLFWSGTYAVQDNVSATHVMLYLGKDKQGEPLMVGASDGRTYKGKQIYGVSVFDFKLPPVNTKSKFLGYSCIPQFTCSN